MSQDYTMVSYFEKRFEDAGRKLAMKAETIPQYTSWKKETTAKLKELIGYDRMQKVEPEAKVLATEENEDYIQQHVVIRTEADVWMPMYVLIPKTQQPPFHPVIAIHGHGSEGKVAVAGIDDSDEIKERIEEYNYDYGRGLCQAGFIVFCPDARGFGERKEANSVTDKENGGSCRILNNMAIPLGMTVTGMWAWDLHRLADYIQTREDCDFDKLTCIGLSGGGMQTLWASALDERIRGAVISGYFYGFKQSLLELNTNCSCNYVPHLWEYVDIAEIAALIAPRPLFIETGDNDLLNGKDGLENVYSQIKILEQAYKIHGKSELLKHSVCRGGHVWHGDGVIEWLKSIRE